MMSMMRRVDFVPSVLLGTALAAPVLGFQVTYICMAALYLVYTWHKFATGTGFQLNRYALLFAIFAGLAGFLALYHSAQFGGDGDMYRTMELVIIFCALVMVLDAVTYLVSTHKLSTVLIAKIILLAVPILLVGKILYLLISNEIASFSDIFRVQGSSNNLFPLNPNHLDNVTCFLMIVLGWSMYTLFAKKCSSKIWLLVGASTILFFADMYASAKSMGGFFALCTGFFVCSAVLILRHSGYKIFAAFLLLVLSAGLAGNVVLHQHSDLNIVKQAKVFMQPGSIKRLTKNACQNFHSNGRPKFEGEFGIMPTASYRLSLAVNAVKIWNDRPLLGHGGYDAVQLAADVEGVNKCIIAYFSHPHNLYLDLLIRGGILLLAVYVLVIGGVLHSTINTALHADRHRMILILPVLGYVIYVVTENMFDLSFVGSEALVAILLNVAAIWGATRNDTELQFLSIFRTHASSFS